MALLKDKLGSLGKYFRNLQYQGNLLIIEVQYPDKIEPFGTKDKRIQVAQSEEMPNVWFYFGKADEVSEDEIFQIMKETVKGYDEAMEKVKLMKEKMEELKNLFMTNTLEKMQTLTFAFGAEKKRKYVRKNKTVEPTEDNIDLEEENKDTTEES